MSTPTAYEVTVANVFDAASPEDAVIQMVTWLIDSAPSAGYRVEWFNPDGTTFIDGDDIDWNSTHEGAHA
jgi:hypothetical protein